MERRQPVWVAYVLGTLLLACSGGSETGNAAGKGGAGGNDSNAGGAGPKGGSGGNGNAGSGGSGNGGSAGGTNAGSGGNDVGGNNGGGSAGSRDAGASGPDATPSDGVLPLSTCGRWIIDRTGRRVKLVGVNWYGANDVKLVVGGLDKAPIKQIAKTIKDLGFNSVRLPFSNMMLHMTKPVAPADVAANKELEGKTPIQVYDAAVNALTDAGLFVIPNSHSNHPMWCCNYDDDGLWYSSDYTEEQWMADWEMIATRYASNLRVIGCDLRNEVRPEKGPLGLPILVDWGTGSASDLHRASTKAGNRILAKNPNMLVFAEGWDSADNLTGVKSKPIVLDVPHKLVYEAHQYPSFPSFPQAGGGEPTYGALDAAGLKKQSYGHWGYIMDPGQPYTAPVWLGEFGEASLTGWMKNLLAYVQELDMDFAYWSLNGSAKASGDSEPYGLLEADWTTSRKDGRLQAIQQLQTPTRGPGINAQDTCPSSP